MPTDGSPWFRRHPRTARWLLALASFLSTLAVFEAGLRVAGPEWLQVRMRMLASGGGTDFRAKVVRSAEGVIGYEPRSEFPLEHPEFSTVARMDEFGGRAIVAEPGGRSLLPLLGDSFTFGVGVQNDETFADALQRQLPYRLINLGIMGTALPQQRAVVERRHAELGRPELYVCFVFLGNDFRDILLTHALSAGKSDEMIAIAGTGVWAVNRWISHGWPRHVYSIQFSKRGLLRVIQGDGIGYMDPIFPMMDRERAAYHGRVRRELGDELDAWQRLQSRNEFRTLFVFVPDVHQLAERRRATRAEYYGLSPERLDPLLPNRLLSEELEMRGLPFIDPTRALAAHPDVESYYFQSDTHMTRAGHAAFAALVGPALRDRLAKSDREAGPSGDLEVE